MKKNPRNSIDGFIPRQSGYVVGRESRTLGVPSQELGQGGRPIDSHGGVGTDRDLQSELHLSLSAIEENPLADDAGSPASRREKRALRKRSRKQKKPLTRKRKILKISAIVMIVLGVLAACFIGYFIFKFMSAGSQVFRGNIFDSFHHQKLQEDANGRTNILIFGTSGWSMDQNNGWDGGLLTDSIIVLSVNQNTYDAYTVSLPRDLYVKHTCTSFLNTSAGKLNETYVCGYMDSDGNTEAGATALMDTASRITGLDVQYYAHANWAGFEQGVNAVGGVDITIQSDDPRGILDIATGINYKNGEKVHMNGKTALAFARARGGPQGGYGLGSNFAREKNQQAILNALLQKTTSTETLLNPTSVNNLIDALGGNLRTNFKTAEVQALIDIARNTPKAKSLPLVNLPGDQLDLVRTDRIGSASVVVPTAGLFNYDDIHQYILKSILGDTLVTVDVLNGSNENGLARTKADELQSEGYSIGAVANAPDTSGSGVSIYKVTDGKEKATKSLEKKYAVTVKNTPLSGYTPTNGADFIIVFGGS